MAGVDILKSPLQLDTMPPKQRAPLTNLPHALNSPVRGTASKRSRGAEGKSLFDDVAAPPAKRQHLDQEECDQQDRENIPPNPVTPPRRRAVATLDSRLGHGGRSETIDRERIIRQQALIAKEKERAREREEDRAEQEKEHQRQLRAQREAQEVHVAKWQRYYEKQFPNFVFYFDNVPEDARRRCSRQVRELGAQEDRFFSRAVTHFVTTRSLPSEAASPTEEENQSHNHHGASGTINPSLLDKRGRNVDENAGTARGKSVFDVALSKKSAKIDVLEKAKELGIKIWQLEKLHRVLKVMFNDEHETDGVDHDPQHLSRPPKKQSETLSKLILREEQSKWTGYDHMASMKTDYIPLTDPYIFVRCMNEKTKPLMVRQYAKVSKPSDGDWPQFRPVTQGKCPFIIEEPKPRRADKEQKRERQEQRVTRAQAADEAHQNGSLATYAKSTKYKEDQNLEPYTAAGERRTGFRTVDEFLHHELNLMRKKRAALRATESFRARKIQEKEAKQEEEEKREEVDEDATEDDADAQNDDPTMRADEDATTDAAQITPTQSDFSRVGQDHVQHSRHTSLDMMAPPSALPRPNMAVGRPGGEPTASGLQRSGATATIRSTMGISSAAAQPGLKAGTSRDVQSLQRRVLDRYSTGSGSALSMSERVASSAQMSHTANSGLIESRRMADIAGRARAENPRAAKTKAQEKIHIQHHPQEQDRAQVKVAQKKEVDRQAEVKREPKPGYCENCKDKFDDFEEHVQTRKHRKFAANKENWVELDALLQKLERPLKRKRVSDDKPTSQTSQRYSDETEVTEIDERASKRSRAH